MPSVVTVNLPDVVTLIGATANRLTNGNKTEVAALALNRLLEQEARAGPLFGSHSGSVTVRPDVDLTAPALDSVPEAETGAEIRR